MTVWCYFAFYLFLRTTALGEINITQNPTILDTLKGDSAGISCHWNSEDDQQVRVQWRKYILSTEEENGTELCSLRTKKNNYSEVRNNKTSCNVANNTAQLTIYSVTEDDGGLYVCQVIIEIPILRKAKGSGTRLNVRHNDNNGELFLDHIYGNVRKTQRSNRKSTSKKHTKKTSV
ncbi:uncharacterized protein [Dendropsophus ebraccatus]|uniref:uncharacterized protein isoform X2 n=1 Tax=Dendropsophus ebraccatus TaxID=150705 RepID=UPI003831ED5B